MTNKTIFQMQGEFMKAGEVKFPDDSAEARSLCEDLVGEEYKEFLCEHWFWLEDNATWNRLKEACDLIIVAAQELNTCVGDDKAQLLLEAVMRNNMTKFPDGVALKRPDGKIMKPEGFDKMGWMSDFENILK